jgi:hypothetical protein
MTTIPAYLQEKVDRELNTQEVIHWIDQPVPSLAVKSRFIIISVISIPFIAVFIYLLTWAIVIGDFALVFFSVLFISIAIGRRAEL